MIKFYPHTERSPTGPDTAIPPSLKYAKQAFRNSCKYSIDEDVMETLLNQTNFLLATTNFVVHPETLLVLLHVSLKLNGLPELGNLTI